MDATEEALGAQLPSFITIALGPENGIQVDLGSFHPLMAYAVMTRVALALEEMIEDPVITFNDKVVYSVGEYPED